MKRELGATLARHIPLTLAMGLTVEQASPRLVRLAFPLKPNRNHQGTAFGGSLYCAAALAGWGLLWCLLKQRRVPAVVVIAGSGERFLAPVDGPFTVECSAEDRDFERALALLRRRGKARVELESEVRCAGKRCLVFGGSYGLLRKHSDPPWEIPPEILREFFPEDFSGDAPADFHEEEEP